MFLRGLGPVYLFYYVMSINKNGVLDLGHSAQTPMFFLIPSTYNFDFYSRLNIIYTMFEFNAHEQMRVSAQKWYKAHLICFYNNTLDDTKVHNNYYIFECYFKDNKKFDNYIFAILW